MGSCLDVDGSGESGILKRVCVGPGVGRRLCSVIAGSGEVLLLTACQEGNLAV